MKKVAGYIQRKSMLYKTGVEYGDYTMNHILGCAHGCMYPCYAFMMKKRFGIVMNYEEWIQPYLVANTLELLNEEIPRLKDKIKTVQLCFSTDPFMYGYDEIEDLSISALVKLNKEGIKCSVLTKGILPYRLCELSRRNEYGGCKTWVSIEPYPTPNIIDQDLNSILGKVRFVDKIIFGRMNYNKRVSEYKDSKKFYREEVDKVIRFCEQENIYCYIKKGTVCDDNQQ